MKSLVAPFLSILPWFSSALLVSPSTESKTSSPYLKSVAGSIGPDHVQIHFKTACEDCFIGTDDGLEVTLDVLPADEECTASGLLLNGVPLVPSPRHSGVEGKVTGIVGGHMIMKTRSSNGLGERDYHTEWNVFCLDQQASLLQVHLYLTDIEDQRQSIGGFSTSFRQANYPWVHRVDPTLSTSREEKLNHSDWILPSPEHRLEVVSVPEIPLASSVSLDLPKQLEELSKMKSEEEELNEEFKDAKNSVLRVWKAEFGHCSSLKCYLQTAIKDAPAFGKLITNHFNHHGKINIEYFDEPVQTHDSGLGNAPNASPDQAHTDNMFQVSEAEDSEAADVIPVTKLTPLPASSLEIPEEPVLPVTPSDPAKPKLPDHPHPAFRFGGPPPWVKEGQRPPWGDGPPPWVKEGQSPPWGNGPPPWVKDESTPPWLRPGFHSPPWGHPEDHPVSSNPKELPVFVFGDSTTQVRQQWRYQLIAAVISFVVVSFVASLLFVCVRHRTRIFRDPRRRADCAARREEWKRKKAYRKAACKYRVRTFLQRFRRAAPLSELAEKGELAQSKKQDEGSAFGHEIGNLRAARDFVGELVRAEEGRVQAAQLEASDRVSITETLPAYSAPPDYAVDVDGDISVIDGFTGYTPSSTDRTPESSVIDCSPRMSFDTQRTLATRSSSD